MKRNSTLYLTRGAMIAALYVALTYLSSLFGLDKGAVQFRISEMLCILPAFLPEAVIGLTIGCVIANLATGSLALDVIFGSLATLIGALGARFLRKLPKKLAWLIPVPTILANAIIVPFVIKYVYMTEGFYWLFFLTVGLGELVCAGIMGTVLYYSLKKSKFI
ncbi:MAG: QueT transporter family protein [Clostridia bacterium]|nr:QueT transporter family protein [Clostridia bacterium]